MMGSMKGYRWMMRDVLFNKNTLSGCEFLFNPITITIAPLVLPSCSAVRVWTTARHASSDHRRHLPDRSLTSGHLPALRPWNTHTHTQTHTHTHKNWPLKAHAQKTHAHLLWSHRHEAFREQNGKGFNWVFDHYRITMCLLGTLVIVSWINRFHSTNCGIHTANQCAACLT